MTVPLISALPTVPSYDNTNFESLAPAFLSFLKNTFQAEMNAAIAAINSYDYGAAVNISKVVGLTAGRIPYGNGVNPLASDANFTYSAGNMTIKKEGTGGVAARLNMQAGKVGYGSTGNSFGIYGNVVGGGGGLIGERSLIYGWDGVSRFAWLFDDSLRIKWASATAYSPTTMGRAGSVHVVENPVTTTADAFSGTTYILNSNSNKAHAFFGVIDAPSFGHFVWGLENSSVIVEKMRLKNNGNLGIGTTTPSTKLHVNGPARVGSYTVATVPSASTAGAGSMIYVTDDVGGAVIAFSNGTNWLRVTDRATVSTT